ncbi:DUF2690 domain-containing protein [Streptacidiphilus sp. PB12-B1b]|uniref:helix-turn-helix domain-containing protein n=1 Tax=Streptacidiphilus sp. PB12-B1b TaxID=2705012 RepID=UPI0015F89DAB|nr:XRE family transcriptional regulator [Streptacidiphilus sp. PB12-B1b]QMU77974.1 DUF2690 domain-containing protein [Streptacidiphilus sp. PB12-B1b]
MTEPRPECRRLAAELRTLRARAGLSMTALAAASTYSRSSWERYLNAKSLPPWSAVSTLCALADEPEPRLRALWERAESAWSGRAATAGKPAPAADPGPTPVPVPASAPAPAPVPTDSGPPAPAAGATSGRGLRLRSPLAAVLASGLLVATLTAGAAYEWRGSGGSGRAAPNPSASVFRVGCTGRSCNGADPQTMLCGVEPQTLADFQTRTGAGIEVRYKPQCQAAWARVWNSQAGDVLSISVPGSATRTARVPNAARAEGFVYTPMVWIAAKGSPVRVCLRPAAPAEEAEEQCFGVPSP